MSIMRRLTIFGLLVLFPATLWASEGGDVHIATELTHSFMGYLAVALFILAYALVPLENNLHLRKSKPVLVAAGLIWVLVALAYAGLGDTETAHNAIRHSLLEYAELFLFLLVAMTYINSLEERNVFQTLRAFLVSRGFSLRMIFWITGGLAFIISPVADNLTTALLMGAVVMAVAGNNKKFVAIACINIIVAANAGGAFSPFGDITTLMVWQKSKVAFGQFFLILIPSLINWGVPALIMSFAVKNEMPKTLNENPRMKYGAVVMMALFLLTIITAVCFHNFLHLPPAAGMMLGLGYLGFLSYHIKTQEGRRSSYNTILGVRPNESLNPFRLINAQKGAGVEKMIDALPMAAFMIDKNHHIIRWNKEMERLTGVKAEDRLGTCLTWSPFYKDRRPSLADLVIDSMPDVLIEKFYEGKHRESPLAENAYDAANFFPTLGESGKWLGFTAAPVFGEDGEMIGAVEIIQDFTRQKRQTKHFDIMKRISRAEWDTLLFFYGVILCVGGLSQFGYMAMISKVMYTDLGATVANSLVGVLSAVVDNIPVMFAVLTMDPPMPVGQWLLVTLTAGTGGSLLSIGSAAGVALMGTARGTYTFGAHLKWTPVIALGYVLSILAHIVLNGSLM